MKKFYLPCLVLFVILLAGCSGKNSGSCSAVGQDYSMCDLTVKTNRLEYRVDNKDNRIKNLEERLVTQEKMLEDMNVTLYKQSKIAANLVKVAYAQRKMAEQIEMQQKVPKARQVEIKQEEVDEKNSPKLESALVGKQQSIGDYKIIEITPSLFKFVREGGLYDSPNGKLLESWNEGRKFTATSRAGSWIKISGFFVNGEWTRMPETRWVSAADILKVR